MVFQRQVAWGWLTAVALFLEGACGGLFLLSFILDRLYVFQPVARVGSLISPGLGILAGIVLLSELGIRKNAFRVITNLSSWMTRGALLLGLTIAFGLGYGIPSLWIPWNEMTGGITVGAIGAICSIFLLLYGGLLLSVAKPIPLWNSSILPILSLIISLISSTGILLLLSPLPRGDQITSFLQAFGIFGIVLILLELVALWSYMEVRRRGGPTSSYSADFIMKMPLFLVGALLAGLAVPLVLLIVGVFVKDVTLLIAIHIVVGVLLLIGALTLREIILRAGVYVALYPI